MANSFSFNGVDMSAYGLTLRTYDDIFTQITEALQLNRKAIGLESKRPAVDVVLDVVIDAADKTTRQSYLDSIKLALNHTDDRALKDDGYTDRYWMARFAGINGRPTSDTKWEGTVTFNLFDPAAFANSATSHNVTVDTDPHAADETAGGTESAAPVITLTADATKTATTVSMVNTTTGETFQWTGDLVSTDILVIDCENGTITFNGLSGLATMVTGTQFLHLNPGVNDIDISGFSGALNYTYPARYA